MQEPSLLPTTFPNVLVSANQGIAVGMASNLCGFNLGEVCDARWPFSKNPQVNLLDHLEGPRLPHRRRAALRRGGSAADL